ncbi:MAG: DHH family phosphoesterase [Thermodesulfobacteriota bacterium]|nr:DHH family phosphoesterase [Thermodesulfobacteriota bacterium]
MGNKEKLKQFFSLFNGSSKVLVVINADPDAIASAMAVKRLLWRKVNETVIAHFNKITRPDNLAIIEYIEPGLVHLDDINKNEFNAFVVVDSQPDHNKRFSEFEFDAIIDHHPLTSDNAVFSDIREEYGACSTILLEYLKANKTTPSQKLAAALMLGIKTDTSTFTRQAGLKDIKAFQDLYKLADNNIVTKVERALFNLEDLDFLGEGIKKRKILKNRIFYHAGNISKPDELVIAADFFLSIAKVNWSFMSGVYDKKLIIVIRNDGLRKGAGITAKEAFSSFGSAGGHKTMARAELDINAVKKEIGSVSKKAVGDWIISVIDRTAGKKTD